MSRRAEVRRIRREAAQQRTAARAAAFEASRAQGRGKQQTNAQRRAAKRARLQAMPPHARRRRRLLRWSWLPALLLLGLAWNLAALGPGYRDARAAYDQGEPYESVDAFERVDRWAVVERWKGAFNAGTAFYRAERHTRAIDYLDEALQTVPLERRCDVQTNRALALQAHEEDTREYAQEQLAEAQALAEAFAAKEAGEPFDAEILEPPYEGAEVPVIADVADGLRYAGYLIRSAADDAALAAEALADPACTPPPSQGGGGGQDEEQEPAGGAEGADAQSAAEQRMQDLLETAAEVERLAQAAEDGTLEGTPTLGDGEQEAQDPAEAEAERQEQLAERNGEAGGGGVGQEDGPADGSGSAPGGGTEPGTGGGGGGRNW